MNYPLKDILSAALPLMRIERLIFTIPRRPAPTRAVLIVANDFALYEWGEAGRRTGSRRPTA